jgi:glycosyltransferase involved in cell wall biosynthesis
MSTINRLVIDGRRLTSQRTGVGRYLETLLNDWSRIGWPIGKVKLVVQDPSNVAKLPVDPALEIKVVGPHWPGLIWENLGLRRELRGSDLLFSPTNLLPMNWRGPSILVVFDTLLEAVPEGFSRSVRWRFQGRYRSATRRASRVIVPSYATQQDVIRYYGIDPHQIDTIYPAIDSEFQPLSVDEQAISRKDVGLDSEPFFLFVGKTSARRNVPAILAAFRRHRARYSSHSLVFVGPKATDPIREEGVIQAGHVSDATLIGLLSGAIAVLYPSEYEGFGLPIAEAMACGCPVMTLRKSAMVESGGDAAFYLEQASTEQLEHAMNELAMRPELRQTHIQAGMRHVAQFQGDAFAFAVKRVIEKQAGLVSNGLGR